MKQKQQTFKTVPPAYIFFTTALALIVCLLPFFTSFAISKNVQKIIEQLEFLQKVDISPEWLPDIEANESVIDALYKDYLACTDEEKTEFSSEQNELLKKYFASLFTVQGKDTKELDKLFDKNATAPENTPTVKPSYTPTPTSTPSPTPEATSTPKPTAEATPAPSPKPTDSPSPTPAATPVPSVSPSPAETPVETETSYVASEETSSNAEDEGSKPEKTPAPTPKIVPGSNGNSNNDNFKLLENKGMGIFLIIILGILAIFLIFKFFQELHKLKINKDNALLNQHEQDLFGGLPDSIESVDLSQLNISPPKPAKNKKIVEDDAKNNFEGKDIIINEKSSSGLNMLIGSDEELFQTSSNEKKSPAEFIINTAKTEDVIIPENETNEISEPENTAIAGTDESIEKPESESNRLPRSPAPPQSRFGASPRQNRQLNANAGDKNFRLPKQNFGSKNKKNEEDENNKQ